MCLHEIKSCKNSKCQSFLQCFVFVLCFSRGGERNATGDGETNTGPEVIQHAVSIPAPSSLLLEKRRGMKIARGDARTCFSVRSQILIDSYICDQ